MGLEIERKFLVKNDNWRTGATGLFYKQGYLSLDKDRTVRVRVNGSQGFLTIKGPSRGAARNEFEFEIPVSEARTILETLCLKPLIVKKRYKIYYENMLWEVDEFFGENEGLIIAEIELNHPEKEFVLPDWIGEEVTDNPAYYNASLVRRPYRRWVEKANT